MGSIGGDRRRWRRWVKEEEMEGVGGGGEKIGGGDG